MESSIRSMHEADLDMVLAWRNHPSVRDFMFHRHEISIDEHTAWFAREQGDRRSHLFILETADEPSGFIRFHEVFSGVADWGFYAAPSAPRGTGKVLGSLALDHAFRVLRLHKVCGQALAGNTRSIRLHERNGFTREGVLRQQYPGNGAYEDLVCFGLLADEWVRAATA